MIPIHFRPVYCNFFLRSLKSFFLPKTPPFKEFPTQCKPPNFFFLELGYKKGKQRWENLQGALDVVKNAQKPANMQTSESTCKVGILGAKTVKNGKNGISRPSVGHLSPEKRLPWAIRGRNRRRPSRYRPQAQYIQL